MPAMGLGFDALYAAGGIVSAPVWGYRMLRTGKWRTDWSGRFARGVGIGTVAADSGACAGSGGLPAPTVLIHAVSVGEVNAVAGLVRALSDRLGGGGRLVVSVTTDTGLARAKELFEPAHRVVRYPLDFSCCVRRFLDAVEPSLVALTELEVWPNFVDECYRRGIPMCVVNGRLSERSFKHYRIVRPWLRRTFARLAAVGAQTCEYADRFIAMGTPAERVAVLDSMKWDSVELCDPAQVRGAAELAAAMGIDRARPVVVAGSTGPGEEKLLIDTCPAHAQLVLVPRKPERFDEVAALCPGMVRRSRHPDGSTPPRARGRFFLVDTMGELQKVYALADVAIVGRSFLGLHGSNPVEPVALGKPTLIGPHHSDFAETVQTLCAAGGIQVTDRPGEAAAELLAHPDRAADMARRGRETIVSRRGATQRHVEMLLRLMPAGAGAAGLKGRGVSAAAV